MINKDLQNFYNKLPRPGDIIHIHYHKFVPYRDSAGNTIPMGFSPGECLEGEDVHIVKDIEIKPMKSFRVFDIFYYYTLRSLKSKLGYVLFCGITKSELQSKIDDFRKSDYIVEHINNYIDFNLINVLNLVELKDCDKHLLK